MQNDRVDHSKRGLLQLGIASVALIGTGGIGTAAATQGVRKLNYEITWHGQKIGTQIVEVETVDGLTSVRHRGSVSVRVLFVEAMKMQHQSEERWEKDQLISLKSETVTNGVKTIVAGERTAEGFHIRTPRDEPVGYADVATLDSFWLLHSVQHRRVIDPKTGEVVVFEKQPLGTKRIKFDGGDVEVDGFKIELDGNHAEFWYHDGVLISSDVTQDGNTAHAIRVL